MRVKSVKGSNRLLAITQAVDPIYLDKINSVNWLAQPWQPDDHWSDSFRRRILIEPSDLMHAVDQDIMALLPDINRACGTDYTGVGSTWHICEADFVCMMHTDGFKSNVMIIYWQTPGLEFGTTFYNSNDSSDVFYQFPGVPNTGFFANYKPRIGRPWPEMWHASLKAVPQGEYRLMTQYELRR